MATLKISDLSVGDWVICNGFKATIAGYNVESGSIQVLTKQKNKMWFGLDDIEPIPITAEVLEKNGFVKKNYDNGKMWDWWCDNVLVRKYADEDIYRFIVALNSKHYTTTMVVGKHTHQLQHALRLAGVDKEINL